MHNEPHYLTSAEAAERLGVDRSTLSRWVASGRIKPVWKMPGRRGPFLFRPADVDALKAA